MNFSAILDISSFFIGMIINLLLIALICYYFKRKYENLEIAQNEQAKVLYQLLQQNVQPKVKTLNEIIHDTIDKEIVSKPTFNSDSDSDSDTDSDSESETIVNSKKMDTKTIHLNDHLNDLVNEIEEISLDENKIKREFKSEIKTDAKSEPKPDYKDEKNELKLDIKIDADTKEDDEKDYSKMTIKQLKEILSVKGINANKLKKVEMIDLIEKSTWTGNDTSETGFTENISYENSTPTLNSNVNSEILDFSTELEEN